MFYIQPPKGLVTLHTLEDIIFSRLEYLNVLNHDRVDKFNGNFEYLLGGSPYDSVGHFTLRLLTSKSNELFTYWISKEILLLKQRLSLIKSRQLYKFFKTILRHLKRREKPVNPVDNVLLDITNFYVKPKFLRHIISKDHSEECNEFHHKIDFELIPDLVDNRSVDLHRGSAIVYCSSWKELFQSLFQTFILFEVKNQNKLLTHFFGDPRLDAIHKKLQYNLITKNYISGNITAHNIDIEAYNFPPCMEHLHLQLRRKHRLSHYARFYYTLFLKECGMSLEDAIIYWKSEYSKPHTCTSLCIHDWHTDAKKFIYSIRHMYGLEGGRKNYLTPNCDSICEQIPGSNYEGGCPFKNFDNDSLRFLLKKSMTENEIDHFMVSAVRNNPRETCADFFKFKNTNTSKIAITKPVQYYFSMIDMTNVTSCT